MGRPPSVELWKLLHSSFWCFLTLFLASFSLMWTIYSKLAAGAPCCRMAQAASQQSFQRKCDHVTPVSHCACKSELLSAMFEILWAVHPQLPLLLVPWRHLQQTVLFPTWASLSHTPLCLYTHPSLHPESSFFFSPGRFQGILSLSFKKLKKNYYSRTIFFYPLKVYNSGISLVVQGLRFHWRECGFDSCSGN